MDSGKVDSVSPALRVVTSSIRFDASYFKTIPGILKCAQLVFSLIGYICVSVSQFPYHSQSRWYTFVSMIGFWVTAILLLLYLLHITEKLQKVPWIKLEFGYCALLAFFYFTAATACAAGGGYDDAWGAAAFFGYVALLAYGMDAYLKFKEWRISRTAQGEHQDQTASSGDIIP